MSKVVKFFTLALVLTLILTLGVAGAAFADNQRGPAPNAGSGDHLGPGWEEGDTPWGPRSEAGSGAGPMGPQGECFRDGRCQ